MGGSVASIVRRQSELNAHTQPLSLSVVQFRPTTQCSRSYGDASQTCLEEKPRLDVVV